MSLEASGGAGAVHPILGGGGRRGLPRWVWLPVLIALLFHAALIVLLSRMGVIQTPLTPPTDQTLVLEPTYTTPPPPLPQPHVQHERTTPPLVDHPTPTPTKPVESLPVQTSTKTLVDEGPKTVTDTPPKPIEVKPEPTAPPVIGQPNWLSQPSAAEMARFYPAQAADDNVEGRAVIRCMVTVAGTLTACTIVQEQPRGYGFGRSAVQLSQYFRMTPRTEDGRPVGGATVDVAIQFKL